MQLRSALDDGLFEIPDQDLAHGSDFFKNMLESCTPGSEIPTTDLYESSPALKILIELIQSPPSLPIKSRDRLPPTDRHGAPLYRTEYERNSIIPLPLLREMLRLVDKYLLPPSTLSVLGEHLAAHAHENPLDVYSLSTLYTLADPASQASGYIGPLDTYDKETVVNSVKSVEAYHDLVSLQSFRTKEMKKILLSEEIFPYGYGQCSSHKSKTEDLWKIARVDLAGRLNTHTDLAHVMNRSMEEVKDCDICLKAVVAATDMLAYKCRKIPRRLDQLVDYQEPY